MYEYRILKQLKKYGRVSKSFHVPGHKARGEFKKLFPVAKMDVTELSYSDNLFCPDGVIAKAQKDVAEILGAKKSWFLTDGSTCGIITMLCVCARRGNKIIVPRNSHQSVWNACKLFGLEPVIVQGESRNDVLLPPAPALIEEIVSNDITVGGMIAISPDYYGNIAPLKEYSEILRRHKRLLIVDGAHGAHLFQERENGAYAGVYADIWVDGAHKSLPTLTQGAILSLNDLSLVPQIEEALSVFRTTSPSYPVMASVEYGVKKLVNDEKPTETAKRAVSEFKEKNPQLTFYPSDDWTKLAIDFKPFNISAEAAAKTLEKSKIFAEFSDGRYILFYLSPMTTARDLKKLSATLAKVLKKKKLKNTYVAAPAIPENERTYSFLYALKNPCEAVSLKDAVGRMCARNAGITPPCIPVVIAGEIISAEAAGALTKAKHTFGLTDGKVWVVKK